MRFQIWRNTAFIPWIDSDKMVGRHEYIYDECGKATAQPEVTYSYILQ